MERDPSVIVRNTLLPGDLGSIVSLHGILYAREYGFDATFEAYVATPLAEFAARRAERERIWIVEKGDRILGSIAIVESSRSDAQLRWFLLHPDLRGKGLGKRLASEAVDFSRQSRYERIFLWTVSILDAAARIYLSLRFHLTEERDRILWGRELREQRYELLLEAGEVRGKKAGGKKAGGGKAGGEKTSGASSIP